MKLRYISDIHLEFIKPNKIDKFCKNIKQIDPEEVCILAGDIGYPFSENYKIFMDHISKTFVKSFVICGNHEFYNNNNTMHEIITFLHSFFDSYDNITFLDNSFEIYNDYTFIGSTLWSKVTNPAYEINDVKKIKYLDYIKYNQLNQHCLDFLNEQIIKHDNIIMITHHMPSFSLIDEKYKVPGMNNYNQWFASDMDKFIEDNRNKIQCWIYGHTHTPCFKNINDIQFLCNPIGYPNENSKLDFDKCFDLL